MHIGALLIGTAQAESLRANYGLSILGLSIGNAFATASLEPSAYKIDIGVKLSGVASMVSNAKGAATANGAIANAAILPAAYANTSANAQETRTVRMGLNAGTVRGVEIAPPFIDMEGRIPVTDAQKRNIVDPVSALVMSVPPGEALVGPAACNRRLPVYDGLVRFDIALSYVGTRNVKARGYSGPVSVCSARYVPVAGYKADSQSTQYMANNRQIEVWLAPVERARLVIPYHISILTKAGTLVIEATEFRLD